MTHVFIFINHHSYELVFTKLICEGAFSDALNQVFNVHQLSGSSEHTRT